MPATIDAILANKKIIAFRSLNVSLYEEGARRHVAVCSGCDHIWHKINAERIEREQEKQKRREQWKRK